MFNVHNVSQMVKIQPNAKLDNLYFKLNKYFSKAVKKDIDLKKQSLKPNELRYLKK